MADDRVIIKVDIDESGGSPSPEPTAQRRRNLNPLDWWRRQRAVQADLAPPLVLHGTTRERLLKLGVDLGSGQRNDHPTAAQYRMMAQEEILKGFGGGSGRGGGGGGGRGGGGSPIGRPRPFHPGQVFQTGVVGRMFGLRAAGLATAGFAGAAFLMVDQALNRLVQTVKALNSAYQQQIENLQKFSPALMVAGAERDVRTTMTRLRLAQEYGPSLAQTYRTETEFRLAAMEFMAQVTDALGPALEFFNRAGVELFDSLGALLTFFGDHPLLARIAFPMWSTLFQNVETAAEMLRLMQSPEVQEWTDKAMRDEEAFFANPEALFNASPDTAVTPFPEHLRNKPEGVR